MNEDAPGLCKRTHRLMHQINYIIQELRGLDFILQRVLEVCWYIPTKTLGQVLKISNHTVSASIQHMVCLGS